MVRDTMKDFIIYIQPRAPHAFQEGKYLVEELKKLPCSSTLKELELVRGGGELNLIRETSHLNLFNFSCKFQLPRPWAAKSVAYSEIVCDLWQQKRGNLVASFNAPKKMSKVAVALLSYATMGDPFLIKSIQLTRSDFLALKEYIFKSGGDLRQLIFWGIQDQASEGAHIKQFRLSGSRLEKLSGFKDLLNRSSKIRLLGFAFKPTADCREIRFRIIDWGGGQLYSPADPLDHEILEFLNLFNRTLIPGRGEISTE